MTKLFFIRHGKTQWNLQGRYQGANADSPLLSESFNEIQKLAHYLEDYDFDQLYTSPLKRALVTAEMLEKHLNQTIPLKVEPALKEFDLGVMEGMLFTEVEAKFPENLHAFRFDPAAYQPELVGSEGFEQVIKRTVPFLKASVLQNKPTANLLYVSHGAALVTMIQALVGTPLADLRKDGGLTNSSVTVVQTNDQGESFQLIDWNQTEFLNKQLKASDTI